MRKRLRKKKSLCPKCHQGHLQSFCHTTVVGMDWKTARKSPPFLVCDLCEQVSPETNRRFLLKGW